MLYFYTTGSKVRLVTPTSPKCDYCVTLQWLLHCHECFNSLQPLEPPSCHGVKYCYMCMVCVVGLRAPTLSHSKLSLRYCLMFGTPEALWTPPSGVFIEASLCRPGCFHHWPSTVGVTFSLSFLSRTLAMKLEAPSKSRVWFLWKPVPIQRLLRNPQASSQIHQDSKDFTELSARKLKTRYVFLI